MFYFYRVIRLMISLNCSGFFVKIFWILSILRWLCSGVCWVFCGNFVMILCRLWIGGFVLGRSTWVIILFFFFNLYSSPRRVLLGSCWVIISPLAPIHSGGSIFLSVFLSRGRCMVFLIFCSGRRVICTRVTIGRVLYLRLSFFLIFVRICFRVGVFLFSRISSYFMCCSIRVRSVCLVTCVRWRISVTIVPLLRCGIRVGEICLYLLYIFF